ncbi:hypothetical protein ABB37_09845 [Leptomonas pyrrhocoris]|uniref:RING-CH-type domain-containing protein n=1 Tax=Leptomonas pyrrhocoris TaxID=157538 RepID=A0A0N0DQU9_LEPPY|nr:hypothetical protein ABB37_09845 [Leptomonas pyrrhocoris]XP_015651981.1 hypothetical protein ABB37_09845 [Leptomonas pyrrhocoris]KPA73541.1 hypothetical protein ABB37_09845 [Leptomonas pyrrhocoris]KPA73542.1 hypothetical protein ABB37_09845 [Leptomonas pyrrhocoris]|eukprot:XP_015651980.1 hypothetical protein ABB37_09845 [Leptomonas pyrrhocoris]
MSASRLLVRAVALLFLCNACTTAILTASAAADAPKLAFFDINRSIILSTTGEGAPTSFGWRSRFSSRYDPEPAVSVAVLDFATPSHRTGRTTFEFLTVPYCVDASGDSTACDLSGRILYMLVRFRRHQEANFQAIIWQDAWQTTSTQKALDAFKARLNRTDVVYPSGRGAMRMEDTAACSDLTDECYLSSFATYTRSFKEVDPSQYSGRFLFRLAEKYSLNSPWRVRLQHDLPHDAEAEVDVVLVLSSLPAVNPLNSRWWLEGVGGRFALIAVGVFIAFGFLACTREVAALLARQRTTGGAAAAAPALFSDDDNEGHFAFLQRVAKVAADGVQKFADYAMAKVRPLNCYAACLTPWRRWWDQRRRLPTSEEGRAETEHEITVVNASAFTEEEETGPICRICRCREPFDDLFAPCACNGSSKYVHHHCLEQWREMTTNPEHRRVCAECKTPYTLVRVTVPQNADLITGSPIIEPALRHYVATALSIVLTVFFAVGGAYGLKSVFFVTTGFDSNIDWSFTQSYHWVMTAYFLLALALNLNIMSPFVKDMESAQLQLLFVLLSLVLLEVPISYSVSAALGLFFDRFFTWEISYGLGLVSVALIYVMDVFTNYFELLDSFAEEREVVAPRASTEEAQPPA